MRILIAEDDPILADGLAVSLREDGHSVDCVATGAEADYAIASFEFDLLILDIGLPRMNGFEVLKRLRGRSRDLPVLILTAQDGIEARVRGLDLGADDYLAKPFALEELKARVRALTRRASGGKPAVVEFGALAFDRAGRVAKVGKRGQQMNGKRIMNPGVDALRAQRFLPLLPPTAAYRIDMVDVSRIRHGLWRGYPAAGQ